MLAILRNTIVTGRQRVGVWASFSQADIIQIMAATSEIPPFNDWSLLNCLEVVHPLSGSQTMQIIIDLRIWKD
jgi:hypothetical protein